MEKVRSWCGQPSDRGRLKNRNRKRSGVLRRACRAPVCLSVCSLACLRSRTFKRHDIFGVCYLWTLLGHPLAVFGNKSRTSTQSDSPGGSRDTTPLRILKSFMDSAQRRPPQRGRSLTDFVVKQRHLNLPAD